MKRLTFSVVITAVLGLAAYTMAGAQGAGRGPGSGPPGLEGPRGGFGRGAGPALRGIELTDEQKAQIQAIREANRESRNDVPAEVPAHRQLQAEVFADVPDDLKLGALQEQVLQAHSARLAKQIALEQQIAQVLTAEQRATVRERLAQGGRARFAR